MGLHLEYNQYDQVPPQSGIQGWYTLHQYYETHSYWYFFNFNKQPALYYQNSARYYQRITTYNRTQTFYSVYFQGNVNFSERYPDTILMAIQKVGSLLAIFRIAIFLEAFHSSKFQKKLKKKIDGIPDIGQPIERDNTIKGIGDTDTQMTENEDQLLSHNRRQKTENKIHTVFSFSNFLGLIANSKYHSDQIITLQQENQKLNENLRLFGAQVAEIQIETIAKMQVQINALKDHLEDEKANQYDQSQRLILANKKIASLEKTQQLIKEEYQQDIKSMREEIAYVMAQLRNLKNEKE